MSTISRLEALVNGVGRGLDLTTNTLVVQDITVGGLSGTNLTKTILDNLVNLQNGTDFTTGTNSHTHDGRYYTQAQLNAHAGATTSGAHDIGVFLTPSHYTAAGATAEQHFAGIDTALGATSAITQLTGDVTAGPGSGSQVATVVSVGGSSAASVHSAAVTVAAATSSNVNSTLVERDSSGNFAATTITAALVGNADTATDLASGSVLSTAKGGTGQNSTATFPTSGVVVTRTATETLQHKTFDNTSTMTGVLLASLTSDGTNTVTMPLATTTLVGRDTTDTLTHKTFDSTSTMTGALAANFTPDGTHTVTFPLSTQTLVGRTSTDTLTNKSIDGNNNTLSNISVSSLITGTVSFDLDMGSHKIINVANGTASTDAVNYGQLTSLAAGLIWQNSINDPDLVDDSLSTPPGSPVYSLTYIIAASPTGAWTGLAGHAVWWDGFEWIDLSTGNAAASGLGTAVQVGDRFAVAIASAGGPAHTGGGLTGKANYIAVVSTNTPGSFAYTFTAPVANYAFSVLDAGSQHYGSSFTYSSTLTAWVDFSGPSKVIAGSALGYVGNTLNVLYDNVTIDLTSNKLEVRAGGISNTQVNASAAIALTKLAATTANKALASGSSGFIVASATTDTQLGYLSGATGTTGTGNLVYSAAPTFTGLLSGGSASFSSTIAASNFSGSSSGTNTGDQTITLTGDVGGSGTGSFAATIANNAVTSAKIASSAFDGITISGGGGSAATVLRAPATVTSQTAGQTFAAATTFVVRWALSGETAGRVYKADQDATTTANYNAIGLAQSTAGASAGGAITVVSQGTLTLGGSDTPFSSGDIGKPVYLTASGAFSITAPTTTNYAAQPVGVVQTTGSIWVQIGTPAIN